MTLPTSGSQTELQAVNQILASVGQAPVTTLEQTNPDVAIAYNTLLEVSREIQAEGWTFNRESNYPIPTNIDNEIVIPDNIIQMDLCKIHVANLNKDAIRRDGKLYDRYNHTFKWEQSPVYVDIVWLFDWEDLPFPHRDFITARAATIVSSRIVGDKTQYSFLAQKEALSRATLMEYECTQGDYSMFGFPEGNNAYSSYQPFHALRR